MRILLLMVTWVCLTAGAGLPAIADQNDPRLDQLFSRLLETETTEQAVPIERQIWSIWLHRGDARIDNHMALGIKAMETGALLLSLREFSLVTVLDPQFAEGWNKRATVHYMMGNLQHSVSDIQRTLALEPRHYGAISGMGLIFDATGNPAGALKAWQQVLKITPYNAAVRQRVEALQSELEGKPI
ncbi:MAG: hypothetical protein HQ483_12080 [Rhodospirillales bacterium]|nr:hypothetical protein [Rhodospirillales bacterium]